MSDRDSDEYGLVMPFVVCKSHGGPFDDSSFVAGAQFGRIFQELESGDLPQMYVNPRLIPQLDLVAMHFDLRMSVEPWDEHNTLVEFHRE